MPTFDIHTTWDGQPVSPAPQVRLGRVEDAVLVEMSSPIYGAAPVEGPPARRWKLWEHEVVELFLAGPGAPEDAEYIELELAPTGHWLALRLRGTRNIVDDDMPVQAQARVEGAVWHGSITFPLALLPSGPLRALATAAHGPSDARRYLAHVPLPAPHPDFHQLHRFTPVTGLAAD